jgi:hypothetical protein
MTQDLLRCEICVDHCYYSDAVDGLRSDEGEEAGSRVAKALALSFRFPAIASKAQATKLPVTLLVKLWSNHFLQEVSQAWDSCDGFAISKRTCLTDP